MPTWPTPNSPRPLTYRMAAALKARRPLCILAAIEHPSGDAYYWSGIGYLEWNGITWTGVGKLGTIAPVSHNSDLTIQEVVFTMTGVDADVVATLSDNVRNLSGLVWLACLDEAGNIVKDPYQLLDAQLDFQSFAVDEEQVATISITARTGFYTLDRSIDEAWTSEQHKSEYPNDTGMDMIASLQNQDLSWTPD